MGQATREQLARERRAKAMENLGKEKVNEAIEQLSMAERQLKQAAKDARFKVSLQYSDGPLGEGEWRDTNWWRVVDKQGRIWCETSDLQEAMGSMEPGVHVLYQLYEKKSSQWKYVTHKEIGD